MDQVISKDLQIERLKKDVCDLEYAAEHWYKKYTETQK